MKKVWSMALTALVTTGCAFTTTNAANASKLISGVALGGNYKGTSTFISEDPAFRLPCYLINVLKPGRFGAGVNLPAVNNGNNILPNIGKFTQMRFDYDQSLVGGPKADAGMNVVIQTNDGFSRIAPATSFRVATINGVNVFRVELEPGEFSPSFNPGQTRLLTASVRYNGIIGPIYVFEEVFFGTQGAFGAGSFNMKTVPDTQFNNQ